jgi:protein tyrosine phosphatase (PTP) superfamily phosphohydrolase (DUF442 family)
MIKKIAFSILLAVLYGYADEQTAPRGTAVSISGCPNVFAATDMLLSGGQPHGDGAFKALAESGVKTIISVDGARPDVEGAQKYGLRYVHIPIGYDGVTRQQSLTLARAVRDLPGKFYIHCHHGKHRSPAAMASILVSSEGWKNEQAVNFMQLAGTSPHYLGLYNAIKSGNLESEASIDEGDATFPAVAEVPDMVVMMVQAEHRMDKLMSAKANQWKPLPDHPDIVPQHEALQLMELFQEGLRLGEPREAQYVTWMKLSRDSAFNLQKALQHNDLDAANRSFMVVSKTCTACHEKYRNNSVLR